MSKKEDKVSEADLQKAFSGWKKALKGMEEKAIQSYMPLLGKVFNMGIDVLQIYEEAFLSIHKSNKSKKEK